MAQDNKTQSSWHKLLRIVLWIVVLAYFPVVMSFVNAEKSNLQCTSVVTRICNQSGDVMITTSELTNIVNRTWPALIGTPTTELNLSEMEKELERMQMIKKCEIYVTPSGVLHVEVVQREPIMHVFGSAGSYYMDSEQYRISAQKDMNANVLVVNGHVNSKVDMDDLINLCLYIRDDAFWHSQIEQIYVTEKHEYVLVPRVGDHIIEFGTTDRMKEKFEDLFAIYKKGWQPHEWNLYRKVNLKYKGQVICTKKAY